MQCGSKGKLKQKSGFAELRDLLNDIKHIRYVVRMTLFAVIRHGWPVIDDAQLVGCDKPRAGTPYKFTNWPAVGHP